MNLIDYIADMDRRAALAAACNTSPDWLYQVATGWNGRKAGHQLAKAIEQATQGQVSRYELRPDIFGVRPDPQPEAQADAA